VKSIKVKKLSVSGLSLNSKIGAWQSKLRLLLGSFDVGQRIRQNTVMSAIKRLNPEGKLILDAGCGDGLYTAWLAYKHPTTKITGVDLNPTSIDKARQLQHLLPVDNLKLYQADLSKPFANSCYDLAYCIDVLEHIQDDDLVLKNLALALKPTGTLLLHAPLSNQKRYFKSFRSWQQNDHVRQGYQEDNLKAKLELNGFKLISTQYTFGWAGALAWEIYELAHQLGQVPRILTSLLLRPLSFLEVKLKNNWGNAIFIEARKKNSK
jgi:ubiquinone/menaquinone biosynthesis C-methylase UbiE